MADSSTPPLRSERLRLRRLFGADARPFDAAHRATTDYLFGLDYRPGMSFDDYVDLLERQRCGIGLPTDRVPATFLIAEVDGLIVGRSSIRHELNDFLRREGGHIGYCVVPEHRRNGYATAILGQSLVIARAVGIGSALVCCDDDNGASATIIERAGGRLDNVITDADGVRVRRYWID